MIDPVSMWRAAITEPEYTAVRFKAIVLSHSSRGNSTTGMRRGEPPALFTQSVREPKCLTATSARFSSAESSVTSVVTARACPPLSLISFATLSISSVLLAATTTEAPASDIATAIPSPIPLPAPVITAT